MAKVQFTAKRKQRSLPKNREFRKGTDRTERRKR